MDKILTLFFALFHAITFGQTLCLGSVITSSSYICPGDSVFIQASPNFNNHLYTANFNSNSIPIGWTTIGTTTLNSTCAGSPNNSPYIWISAPTASTLSSLSTSNLDLSLGGTISFEMLYGLQGNGNQCDGPEAHNEGISLQYSLNNGSTWVDIVYYAPNGTILTSNPGVLTPGITGPSPFTVWNTFSVPIPSNAMSTSTMVRWVQTYSTGSVYDHWGLDNITINSNLLAPSTSNTVTNWNNGLLDTNTFYIQPTGDTSLVALFYDSLGNFQCQSDTVKIKVYNGGYNYSLPDTLVSNCSMGTTPVTLTNFSTEAKFPMSYSWSNGNTSDTANLQSLGVSPDNIWYYVDVTDACGFTVSDSVLLHVNQFLNLSTSTINPQINCRPNGSIITSISGNQGLTSVQWYDSTGQLMNSLGINVYNLVSGWYDVIVTDNVCSFNDSVFVPQINVPVTFNVDSVITNCLSVQPLAYVSGLQYAYQPIYSWSTSNGTPLPFNNSAGTGYASSYFLPNNGVSPATITYLASVTSCGSTVTKPVVLTISDTNSINFNLPDTILVSCPGASVNLSVSNLSGVTGNPIYSWSNGSQNSSTTITTSGAIFEETYYYLTVTDACSLSKKDSTLVRVNLPFSINSISACGSYTWIDGNTYTSSNSVAHFIYSNGTVCDSIVYLDLTIIPSLNPTIINNSPTLTTNYSSLTANYQWIDCLNSNAIIPGATNASFTAQANGQYAVIVSDNSCVDTSICEFVANVGLNDLKQNSSFKLFPNPSDGTFTILIDQMEGTMPISILNSVGQIVYETSTDQKSIEIQQDFSPGVYFIKVSEQQLRLILK